MKYLVYYDTPANKAENRNFVLAATNKIDYICSVLNRCGIPVELVSASATNNRKGCGGKTVQVTEKTSLKLFSCMGTGRRPKRVLGRILFHTRLFLYLLCHIQKGESILVYHSLGYSNMVRLLRKLRDFRLILEVEEIYGDVTGRIRDRKKEFKLFSAADAYLFSTELLNNEINESGKPYVLIHGTYQVEPDRGCRLFDDGKIHCVYAGTFDPRKGGAAAAAAAAEFLPEQYHIHILGFGNKEQTDQMRKQIDLLATKCKCGITYDGLLSGEDYIRFLQSCDIGLSTQNPDAAFNATSFPSKILSYMANGLRVVSIRIPAAEGSAVGNYLYFYDEQTPEAIADAIQRIDINDSYESRDIISCLDKQFEEELGEILKHEYPKS